MAVVGQDSVVFRTSVLDNIRLGCPNASREEVEAAAAAANALEFIQRLPEGWDTQVCARVWHARMQTGSRRGCCLLGSAPGSLLRLVHT